MIHRFRCLKYVLALVLVFVGLEILAVNNIGKTHPTLSLSVKFALMLGGALYSLRHTRREASLPVAPPTRGE